MKAHRIFFPLAAGYALAAAAIWALVYTGHWNTDLRLTPWIHGQEMIYGFAMAVITGYLLTRPPPMILFLFAAVWIVGRWSAVHPAVPPMADAGIQILYPLMIAGLAGVPFLRSAKSLRNAATPLVILGFAAAQSLYQLGRLGILGDGGIRGLYLGIDLVTALLFLMGGRIIAGAASGALRKGGHEVPRVAQPGLERAGLLGLIALGIGDIAGPDWLAGLGAGVAGAVIILRLIRWRFWKTLKDAPLSFLQLGYLWLGAGLLLRGLAGLGVTAPVSGAMGIHAIGIGGLGTLALAMMIRTMQQRERWPIELNIFGKTGLVLISIAALLWLLSFLHGDLRLVPAAGIVWSFGMVNYFFAALPPPRPYE